MSTDVPRIVLFVNNQLGLKVVRWLRDNGVRILGVCVHPESRAKYRQEIIETAGVDPACLFEADRIGEAETVERIRRMRADLGISVMFGYIFRSSVLDCFPRGIVNLHTGLLPHNRGAHPNVWAIVDRTPAGATLHLVDGGVDTGPILAQQQVTILPEDTGESLYARLEDAAFQLFVDTWPGLRMGSLEPRPQESAAATAHRAKDVGLIDRIRPDQMYKAGELIDILRARTFPPHRGAYLDLGDRRIYIRVSLEVEQSGDS